MKKETNPLLGWVLVGLGILFLGGQVFPGMSNLVWAAAFIAGGLVLFTSIRRDPAGRKGLSLLAYIFVVIGGIILIDMLNFGFNNLTEAFVLVAVAAPFFYMYVRNRENWWALIPGGTLLAVGVALVIGDMMRFLPVLMIVGGVYFLVREYMSRRSEKAGVSNGGGLRPIKVEGVDKVPPEPMSGPEADK